MALWALPGTLIAGPIILLVGNQYGVAADIPNIYRDKGYGLEVQPPVQK